MAVDIASKKASGAALGIVGVMSYAAAGIQDIASGYLIENNNTTYGYCCINNEKCLVQIFLLEEYKSKMEHAITALIDAKLITSASLSSNEPISFNQYDDFHTYAFEWTPDYIAWFIDGEEVYKQTEEHVQTVNRAQKIMMNIWNPEFENKLVIQHQDGAWIKFLKK